MSSKVQAKSHNVKDPVEKIPHIGQALAKRFSNLRIKSVEDLFRFVPRTVVDLSSPIGVKKALNGEGQKVVIFGRIEDLKTIKTPRRHIWITSAKISDGEDKIRVVWFHQPYLRTFFKDQKYAFFGPVEYSHFTKEVTMVSPEIFPEPGVIPIYHMTEGLSSKQIQKSVKYALEAGYHLAETIPEKLVEKYSLQDSQRALLNLHFPKDIKSFHRAKERFIFDELFVFTLTNLYLKNQSQQKISYKIDTNQKLLKEFKGYLPFILTTDQNKATLEIIDDFKKPHPMNRLLQGDVGSGKTIVSLAAAYLVIKSGFQVAYLAPTQILAHQHYETAKKIFGDSKIKVELVTGATSKKQVGKAVPEGDLIIGTHALLQKGVSFPKLGLVIIDEQHRFGVEQRSILIGEGRHQPHLLSLSATPIPRTLTHIIFGNLDVSTIKTKPAGRLPIKTYLIPEDKRPGSYQFINELISRGQRAFVVCPLIEEKVYFGETLFDETGRKAVESEIKNLKKTVLGERKIEMLHGKMKSEEKQLKMQKMKDGRIDVLVSTSVVEVGVDVEKATVMIVEEAERFGLSQLHQFRGRVGRSDLQSYCFLFTNGDLNEKTRARLKTFVRNSDGFELSQMDLKQRGPGAIFGLNQSGFDGINPLWFEDTEVMSKASNIAKELVDGLEKRPGLFTKVKDKVRTNHSE